MPKELLNKEIKGTYRGKPVIKLLGEWAYFSENGKGHRIEKKYYKNIKFIE